MMDSTLCQRTSKLRKMKLNMRKMKKEGKEMKQRKEN